MLLYNKKMIRSYGEKMAFITRLSQFSCALLISFQMGGAGVFMATPALAHGGRYVLLADGAVKGIEFGYTDGQKLRARPVQVFAPNNSAANQADYTGLTDQNGRFAFIPDQPGLWRLESQDEEGHVIRAAIMVGENSLQNARQVAPNWLVAVSLVLNVLAVMVLARQWQARRPKRDL
jgi:nickel transport protein